MWTDLIGKTHAEVGHCAGLATIACRRLGVPLPDWGDICLRHAQYEIESRKNLFTEVTGPPQPGDLVHITPFDNTHHVAVVISPTRLIQSTSTHGVHIIRIDHPWIKDRIVGVYRYAAK
jgi:cell wall-associated NlpC family hydrolase